MKVRVRTDCHPTANVFLEEVPSGGGVTVHVVMPDGDEWVLGTILPNGSDALVFELCTGIAPGSGIAVDRNGAIKVI